jgi:hypothetical protein
MSPPYCVRPPSEPTFFLMDRQPLGRKLVAAILVLPVLAAVVLPPLLDAGAKLGSYQVESEHDPATCGVLHDHAICSQITNSFSHLSGGKTLFGELNLSLQHYGVLQEDIWTYRTDHPTPSPRGPPTHLS